MHVSESLSPSSSVECSWGTHYVGFSVAVFRDVFVFCFFVVVNAADQYLRSVCMFNFFFQKLIVHGLDSGVRVFLKSFTV